MKDVIIKTLEKLAPELKQLEGGYYVIGGAALLLQGVPIGKTHDIDIITTTSNAIYLEQIWAEKLVVNPTMKDNGLFHSHFGQYKFPDIEVEVQGDLQVFSNGKWKLVTVQEFDVIQLTGLDVKVPTLGEIKRILSLFGRDKDNKRIAQINTFLTADKL